MSLLEQVKVLPRDLKVDSRGWFLKVIDGSEDRLPSRTGEVYVTLAEPGQIRGNHYHPNTCEWFSIVVGKAELHLCDPGSGERIELLLDAASPSTVFVPAGLAHAFKNPETASGPFLLVAYADHRYDPGDTVRVDLV
jgi:dTDP-4-dehydrorhamnose 3,5-epimerase-like enzyme